jgi:signal transduction histidine kinase
LTARRSLSKSIYFQLGFTICLLTILIGIVLHELAHEAKVGGINKMSLDFQRNISDLKSGASFEETKKSLEDLSENLKQTILDDFHNQVVIAIFILAFAVCSVSLVLFHYFVGRHIEKLIRSNKITDLSHIVLFPEKECPPNEIGEVMEGRNKMLLALKDTHHAFIRTQSSMELSKVSNKMSHEILNPLSIISGVAEMLEELVFDPSFSKKDMSEELKLIVQKASIISKMMEELDNFSSIHEITDFCNVDLSAIILSIVNNYKSLIDTYEVNISIEGVDTPVNVWANYKQLYSGLDNIIKNSLYSIVPLDERILNIKLIVKDEKVSINIIDSCKTTIEEVQEQLNSEFSTTKDIGRGLGLSLILSRAIIENHQGVIDIKREDNLTHFIVILPLSQELNKTPQKAS